MMDRFRWEPYQIAPLSQGFRYADTPFENGSYQRCYKGRKPREWSLTFKVRYSVLQEIKTFWETHNDTSTWTFLWDDPWADEAVVVCFADPSTQQWETQWQINGMFDIRLKEVI